MNASAYQLRPRAGLMFHDFYGSKLVADNELHSSADIRALVASGDGFITLATIIDDALEFLPPDAEHARPQLETTAATLLYLQRYYQIKPKDADEPRV